MWILPFFGILKQKIGAQCLLMYCMSFCIWLFDLGKIWYLYCVRVVAYLQHFKPAQKFFRAQFFWTEMFRSAGVLFSLFLSFSLFFSQKHTLPTFILFSHPRPALFWVNCNCIPTVFERWQVADLDNWVSAWNNCREGVFLWANKRKGEKKRKREKNTSNLGHSSKIELCSKIFSFFSFSLFLSLHTFNILGQPKKTLSLHLLHALTQLSRSATIQLFLKGGWSGILGECMT